MTDDNVPAAWSSQANAARNLNRFSILRKGLDAKSRQAWEATQFEHQRLQWMIGRLKLTNAIRDVYKANAYLTGKHQLSFEAFNQAFPTFPFVLGSNNLKNLTLTLRDADGEYKQTPSDYMVHTDVHSLEPARFKSFMRVPFVIAYIRFYDQVAASVGDRGIAMLFPRKGFASGMVIHNDGSEQYWPDGLSWVYKFPKIGSKLYVQPFSSLVEAIYAQGHGWKP